MKIVSALVSSLLGLGLASTVACRRDSSEVVGDPFLGRVEEAVRPVSAALFLADWDRTREARVEAEFLIRGVTPPENVLQTKASVLHASEFSSDGSDSRDAAKTWLLETEFRLASKRRTLLGEINRIERTTTKLHLQAHTERQHADLAHTETALAAITLAREVIGSMK